jgi:hypothetical protein
MGDKHIQDPAYMYKNTSTGKKRGSRARIGLKPTIADKPASLRTVDRCDRILFTFFTLNIGRFKQVTNYSKQSINYLAKNFTD